jgi:hypothetical protein
MIAGIAVIARNRRNRKGKSFTADNTDDTDLHGSKKVQWGQKRSGDRKKQKAEAELTADER